jgi:VWFA-related protein
LAPRLAAADPVAPPIESDLTERVEVRFVIVDVVVLDRQGRTVADLTRDDFELFVDYEAVAIDALDASCPAGGEDDPRPLARAGDRRAAVPPDVPRRIVLAFDYMHMSHTRRTDVLARAREMVLAEPASRDEFMVATIAAGLTIEQPFTSDAGAVAQTLRRLDGDERLWLAPTDHEHEHRFFRNLAELADLLGLLPGPKAVVLFSDLGGPSASYDLDYETVASRAAMARVAFYPVQASGLTVARSSARLARLAVETGGRFTEKTNDLSVGLARARRELTCRYALGFYDRNAERDRPRRISVRVRRPRLRPIFAASYEFPSEQEQRRSLVRSGWLAPGTFDRGAVRGRFVPLRPRGPGGWQGVVAVGFPAGAGAATAPPPRDVAAVIRRGRTVLRRVERRIVLEPLAGGATAAAATLLEPLALKPGEYALAAVALEPGPPPRPESHGSMIELPPVPDGVPFVVGPVLGRRPSFRVVKGPDAEPTGLPADFEPLVDHRVAAGESLSSLVSICRVGRAPDEALRVESALRSEDGRVLGRIEPTEVILAGDGEVRCATREDLLPAVELGPGGHALDVTLRDGADVVIDRRSVRFEVGAVMTPAAEIVGEATGSTGARRRPES